MQPDFVHDLFSRTAERRGDAVALSSDDRQMGYRELEAWSNNVANLLLERGLEPGRPVAIAAHSTFVNTAAILAVLKAGGVFVPLDPSAPLRRLQAQVGAVEPAFWLVQQELRARLGELRPSDDLNWIEVDREDDDEGAPCLLPRREDGGWGNVTSRPAHAWSGDDCCYIYFTSGSTGGPKPIAGRLRAIDHFLTWEIETFGLGDETRGSQLTTPVFDAFLRDVFAPLCAGGTVVVPSRREHLLTPDGLADWLESAGVTLVHTVPSLFRILLAADLRPERLPALRHVLLAGEPLLPSDVRRWCEVFGERIELVNLYGPSETTMTKLFYRVRPQDGERRSIPIGQPMPGTRALLLSESGEPCPLGTVGEIYIRTPFRSLGYYGLADQTAASFVPNPLADDPDDVVYKTGDLGRLLEDGELEFLGRRDGQVKVRGVRVELAEVEEAIMAFGGVREAAVVDREDAEGNRTLCCYLVCEDGARDVSEPLRGHLAQRLVEAMIPPTFVELEALPRTPTGKVDRRALAELRDEPEVEYVAPRDEVESRVVEEFASTLDRERVGIRDNFFQIGGHSLLAMVLLSRLSASFEVELPLGVLFEAPTPEALAARIAQEREQQAVRLPLAAGAGDDLELSAAELDALSDQEVDDLLADVIGAQ